MKKLALAAVLVLAACGTKDNANNAVDTTMTGTPCWPDRRIISMAAARSWSTRFTTYGTPFCERNSFVFTHQGQVAVE